MSMKTAWYMNSVNSLEAIGKNSKLARSDKEWLLTLAALLQEEGWYTKAIYLRQMVKNAEGAKSYSFGWKDPRKMTTEELAIDYLLVKERQLLIQDYDAALERIDMLMDAKKGTPEGDELDILTALVEAYEAKDI